MNSVRMQRRSILSAATEMHTALFLKSRGFELRTVLVLLVVVLVMVLVLVELVVLVYPEFRSTLLLRG